VAFTALVTVTDLVPGAHEELCGVVQIAREVGLLLLARLGLHLERSVR
jgi:hypothetical protein